MLVGSLINMQAQYLLVNNTPMIKGKLRVKSLQRIGRMPQEMLDVLDEPATVSLLNNDISWLQGCVQSSQALIDRGCSPLLLLPCLTHPVGLSSAQASSGS